MNKIKKEKHPQTHNTTQIFVSPSLLSPYPSLDRKKFIKRKVDLFCLCPIK